MKIEFSTGNAAFDDGHYNTEVCRILDAVKLAINQGFKAGVVRDINGNLIGSWTR